MTWWKPTVTPANDCFVIVWHEGFPEEVGVAQWKYNAWRYADGTHWRDTDMFEFWQHLPSPPNEADYER